MISSVDVINGCFTAYFIAAGIFYIAVVCGTFFGAADVCNKSYGTVATRVFHCLFWSLFAALCWPIVSFVAVWVLYYNTVTELKGH